MKLKSVQYVLALLLTFMASMASTNTWATVTCTASSPSYSTTYLPTVITKNVVTTSFTVACTRDTSGSDPQTFTYTVTANNGANLVSGTQNRAKNASGDFLNYELYKNSDCTSEFQGANTYSGSMTLNKSSSLTSAPYFITGCIAPLLFPSTAGTYTDNVTLTVTGDLPGPAGPVVGVNGAVAVAIATPPTCIVSTPPGNIILNYTAFQASAGRENTPFRATCSGGHAYIMEITDSNTTRVTNAVAAGLNYSLGVSTTPTGTPANPLAATGTGATQDGYIIVTAPANQAGSCLGGCSQTNTHYLTLTY